MQEYYELGMVAAIADLENAAANGDQLAEKIAMALPEEFKNLDPETVELAWEYQEKVAGAKWDAVKGGVESAAKYMDPRNLKGDVKRLMSGHEGQYAKGDLSKMKKALKGEIKYYKDLVKKQPSDASAKDTLLRKKKSLSEIRTNQLKNRATAAGHIAARTSPYTGTAATGYGLYEYNKK